VDKKDRKSLKVMARAIQLAVAGTWLALKDGKIDPAKLDPTRFGVEFGASLIPSELDEIAPAAKISSNCMPGKVDLGIWGHQGLSQMPPLWMLKYLPNMSACHVSILHNAQGPNNTITENDVAPLLAINEAYRIITRGQADVMLCGGGDSKVNPLSLTRLCLFSALTKRNDAPQQASRPFDRRRDGVVPGEGGGVLVLEELAHARKRSAPIYGEVVGTGASFDLKRNGDGLARAMTTALREAQIGPEEVDHINAQGFSTLREDVWEARAIHKVFGQVQRKIPVFVARSFFGTLGTGSTGAELAASLLALRHGVLPPSLNYEEPDPQCPVNVLAAQSHPVERDYFVKLSFTELGQCAALVVRRWRD
jgi:3-oxoacyl-[acyl-carrier-protein] synthase II